jgi:hypothetical protein
MKKLWVFGDSFSAPFNDIGKNSKDYIKLKGYQPKVYCDLISEKLGITGINCAEGGLDNYSILNKICDRVDEIEDGDIIIIGWSSPVRFRIVNKDGWRPITPEYNSEWANVFINRGDSNLYWEEVISWSKLINKKFNNQIIHFSPFASIDSGVPKNWIVDIMGIEGISQETKGKLMDGHYSENGHITLSKIFLKRIENNTTGADYFSFL